MNAQQVSVQERASEVALERFSEFYNCAESVLSGLVDAFGLEAVCVPRVAAAFGGGIGLRGEVCGAVTGAVMAMGLSGGDISPDEKEARGRLYAKAGELMEAFNAEFGSVRCRDLVGCELSDPECWECCEKELDLHGSYCRKFVEFAARKATELMRRG